MSFRWRLNKLKLAIGVGSFLAWRQICRASYTTTGLIIFVMTLTFLNLVVVSGILVGLIEGSTQTYREHFTSDVIVSNLKEKTYIEQSPSILQLIGNLPWTDKVTARYSESGVIEAGYKTRLRQTDLPNEAGVIFTGIDPVAEDAVTDLSQLVEEGSYLRSGDYDQVLLGYQLLRKYLPIDSPGLQLLDDVDVGDKVRVTVNGIVREVTVKGIIHGKVDEIGRRVFFVDSQLRSLIGRSDFNVDEIAIKVKPNIEPAIVRDALIRSGVDERAKVQTWEDAQPKFLKDIIDTFALLGNMVGSIGLVVASITIFIVIFINAITRRKYIGILKGIGIDGLAIEVAYVIQSLFYALVGTVVGMVIIFFLLKPYFTAQPIDFPFSDGILVATIPGTLIRAFFLFVATLIAGYIPAKLVVRQNTLDSILGR